MNSDSEAPAWVVRNEQRRSVSGEWPGCRGCDHVYAHADDCELLTCPITNLVLSAEAMSKVIEMVDNPPPPNEALRRLMRGA